MKRTILNAVLGTVSTFLMSCGSAPKPQAQPVEPRQPVEIRAYLDKAVATTGDQITYTVEVDRQKEIQVELSEPGAEIAGLRIIDSQVSTPEEEGDRMIERRTYLLRADLVGSYVLPEVRADYHPSTGKDEKATEPATISTSRIFLEVKSVLPKDGSAKDIREIKPLEQPDFGLPGWIWVVISIAVIGTGTLSFWLVKRRGRKLVTAPTRPPHETAFEALDALRATNFDDLRAVRKYYFAISEAVRQYTEQRFALNATDLTTQEILERASNLAELGQKEQSLLADFLVHTDLVKFANRRPGEKEIRNCYDQAVQFVELTIPAPVESTDEPDRRAA